MNNNIKMLKHHWRTMIILALCLCIPFIAIWYIASYVNENIFKEQKENYLMAFAKSLDYQLCDGGYDEILAGAGFAKAAEKDKLFADPGKDAMLTDTGMNEMIAVAGTAKILFSALKGSGFSNAAAAKITANILESAGLTAAETNGVVAGILKNFKNDDFTEADINKILSDILIDTNIDAFDKDVLRKDKIKTLKVNTLYKALFDITENIAKSSEGLGVGYYSKELDAMLTYGRDAEFGHNVGGPIRGDHPGRGVMASGRPGVSTSSTQVRGNIMNAMWPLFRDKEVNGETEKAVIGYIWANEPIKNIEKTLSRMSVTILLLLIASYIIMLITIIIFILRMIISDQKRDKILGIMNRVATVLLAVTDEEYFEKSLLNGLEIIGRSMEADCVQIWQNETRGGELCFALKYKWLSEAGLKAPPVEIGTAIPYSQRWKELFLRGECVNGPVARLPKEDQDLLGPLGLLSTITIPLYYEDKFWGVFCVDDVVKERHFPQAEIDVLRSATLMMVNALNRNLIQRELKTALKKTEEVLEQNKLQITKLDMAIQASKVGLWEMEIVKDDPVNPDNVFIWSNELRHMLGYKDENDFPNVLSSWSDLLHPGDKGRVLNAFAAHLSDTTGETPYNMEYRLLKFDGEYSYYHAAGATVRDKNGSLVRVVGTLVDITETKNIILDSERQRIRADAANKAKSNFLSTMSHEIRTPMNAIIGMTAIGKLSNDARKKDDALNKIDGASKHLLGIINDVLDMSKIEADKFELSAVSFDFEKMLQKITDVISLRVNERRQKFYIQIDKNIPRTLVGDDQRLTQVITNLLSNAVKFTPEEGTIRLDSRLISEENGVCRLQIGIEDTGIGITDEQKARLFKSFEQAEATTTRKYGGTGLGLAITKRIVELMDGEIWVESEPGRGSKFIFTFLMKRCAEVKKHLLDECVNWENLRIFAVDYEPEVREFFMLIAENLKISCTVSASGEEAVGILADDDNYDIYFIDWKLPGMNGIELARQIHAKASRNSIITLFSSADWRAVEDEAREAGVDKFLSKPLFPSMIVDVINTCMNKPEAEASERAGRGDDFSGCTVLLADDVEINREIVLALLEPTGLAVDCAENGVQALEMFKAAPEKYGMIFMDIQMPEMDGYDATRQIRALGAAQAKTVPIIAMTANVFREDIEKSIEAGMNGHIGKPIDLDDVLKKLRQYLR